MTVAACAKPPNVDELQWRQAVERAGGLHNPDRLFPVPAQGFKDLLARKAAQVHGYFSSRYFFSSLVFLSAFLQEQTVSLLKELLESLTTIVI